ncbi:MFS transporter [Jiulongibacter sediminis]|uniref:Major facilitator transporter n=1 Tax=Jiulongibacter sediminis TaxID=1605367 RepID=A0A0P7BZX9_9BACT|nr:MFS transporter [Jiulongibacter sediminis]KPM47234.1 major facilitator transporter [Jiulongibacter sediminis]TBX22793.1 major facilitator transporter [Jiulongibacter sediminis]
MNKKVGNYRWTICALVFFATTVNYLDRQVISLLKSVLSEDMNWDDGDYANIEIAFKMAYMFGMVIAGRVVDKLGTKKGYALATGFWSVAAMGHALASNAFGFMIARGALGVSEAGNFPAAIKTTAEWFPKKERAFATGIFNSGTNVGAILAPLTVPFIAVAWGWQWAFVLTGAIGFIWLILWQINYTSPSESAKLSKEEYDYIHSDKEDEEIEKATANEKVPWIKLLGFRQTWAFAMGKFLTDPIWWFYLFWLPDFLESEYNLTLVELAIPVAVVYFISTIGSIGGGYLPLFFMNKNMPAFRARKTSMFIFALFVFPVVLSQWAGQINMWLAVFVIGIAAAAHQAWSANIFTTVSDMFPKKATASVTGIGGMAGGLGGIVLSWAVQKNLFVHYREIGQIEKAYFIMFLICGAAYLLAWLVMHFLVPKMDKVKI